MSSNDELIGRPDLLKQEIEELKRQIPKLAVVQLTIFPLLLCMTYYRYPNRKA
jgi:hypothetical protein